MLDGFLLEDTGLIITILGSVLSATGILLAIWSLWYAKKQSKLLSDAHRNEMISLWAQLDRVRTLMTQVEEITQENGFIKNGTLTRNQQQILPKIHKGVCDDYVRIVELIVKKSPQISLKKIEQLLKMGIIKSDWQKQQFVNLVDTDIDCMDNNDKK